MSDSEDFEQLKVIDLQDELEERGLDAKGNKVDSIDRLRQTMNSDTEQDPATLDSAPSDDESAAAVRNDETSSSLPTRKDTNEQEQTAVEANVHSIEDLLLEEQRPDQSSSSKKRLLTDVDTEKGENNEDHASENHHDGVEKDDEQNQSDDISNQKRKKKSRWGSEQDDDDDSPEKQSTSRQTSDDDDDNGDDRSSRHPERDHDRTHHRSSRQHDDDRHYSSRRSEKSAEREIPLPEEETVQFNDDDVVLDFYTADLNLTVNTDCLSASTKSNDALCFLWAGIRATYGFKQGKVCFEIRVTEIIDCPQMPESENEKFGIRIGWSNLSSGLRALQLGESNDSYAFTSTGKKLSTTKNEGVEETYGDSFGPTDVIASYIDFGANDDLIRISFSKNGEELGQAFEFPKSDSKEFYPHILAKNVKFECNFGQLENAWSQLPSDYIFAQNIPLADRIRASVPIVEKSQCQVVFLSGLIGSGKTTWAKKYVEDNPEKNFDVLNVEHVLSRMTVDGKAPVVKDRNDGLMLRVNVCLQKLIGIAAQRRRNYIIDHINTTRESQSKRQRLFTGYNRIGVVIVPDDDELKRRLEKIEKLENITIPSHWIREAKAKFHFPQRGSSLEDVLYPELSYEDAKSLYEKVRQDYDRYRSSSRYDRRDDYDSSRSSSNNYSNYRNRYDDRDRYSRERDRNRDRHSRSRSRSRERDRRTSRDDSRFSSSSSSSYRNDNYRGGYSRGGSSGGRYSDYRSDSRNNQRGGFNEGGGNYRGRGGHYNNQSNDEYRGGYQQQQRNDYGNERGRGRGSFDNNRNQYNNRGSYQDRPRGGGFRQEYGNQQRGRPFNDYDNNNQRQEYNGGSRGYMQNNNNNNFHQQHDRPRFDSRPPMQQQNPFHNPQQQQRPPLLSHNPASSQQQQQQQQYPSHMAQQATNNPNASLQAQSPMGVNTPSSAANVTQQNSLDPWLALYAAALNPQSAAPQQSQQPQQDTNSLAQQWAQWLKTNQLAQTAQQSQPTLTAQPTPSQQQQQQQQTSLSDATAMYYQAYYAQLAAAQQQAAAAASLNGGVAPPNSGDK